MPEYVVIEMNFGLVVFRKYADIVEIIINNTIYKHHSHMHVLEITFMIRNYLSGWP